MEGNRRSLALCALTVSELARGLENGSFSSEAVTDAYLENIALQNSTLNVFLEVFGDTAREEARASDRRRREGKPLSRLDGVPFAVKDNLCVEGRLCTCASRMLARGLSLKEIGDHLGHSSTQATTAYTKVDMAALRAVAAFDLGGMQ